MRVFGVLLILAGVLALIYGGFTYNQSKKVVDVGPVEARTNQREAVRIPPLASGAAVLAGIVMVLADRRSTGGRRLGD
jgi:drug/metabolite transporter (DMT)-like permease